MTFSGEPTLIWIRQHGSVHLKKAALEAGMLDQVKKLYLTERLALELPGWNPPPKAEFVPRENPSEIEIDAFLEARKKFPEGNVRLCTAKVTFSKGNSGCGPVLIMNCPWSESEIVYYIREAFESAKNHQICRLRSL
jgi:hypothetical protein